MTRSPPGPRAHKSAVRTIVLGDRSVALPELEAVQAFAEQNLVVLNRESRNRGSRAGRVPLPRSCVHAKPAIPMQRSAKLRTAYASPPPRYRTRVSILRRSSTSTRPRRNRVRREAAP